MKVADRWHYATDTPGAAMCRKCDNTKRKPQGMTAAHGLGSQWQVTMPRVNGKKGPKRDFRTKDAAQEFVVQAGYAHANGTFVAPSKGKITFREVALQQLTAKISAGTIRESSRDTLTFRLERYVFPILGDRRIGSIETSDVEACIASWRTKQAGTPLAVATRRGLITDIRGVFKFAASRRYVPKGFNPAADITLPRKSKKRMVLPAEPVVEAVESALAPRYAALLDLAVGTGMRISEMLGITRDRITFTPDGRMVIEVDRQLAKSTTKTGPVFCPPKTSAGTRMVMLTMPLTEIMKRHLAKYCAADGLIFTVRGGAPLRYQYAQALLSNALRSVGAKPPVGKVIDKAGWHQFRHLHTSEMIKAGEDPVTVAKRLGHEDIAVTFNTYAHLFDESQAAMIANLEAREQERATRRAANAKSGLRIIGGTEHTEAP